MQAGPDLRSLFLFARGQAGAIWMHFSAFGHESTSASRLCGMVLFANIAVGRCSIDFSDIANLKARFTA